VIALLGTALLFQTGCSKTDAGPTKDERIKSIDVQLAHWVVTGHSEDVSKRDALKAERARLAADLGYSTSTSTGTPVFRPQMAVTPVPGAPYVIVAPVNKAKRFESTENRFEPMATDSSWMDSSKQTHVHSGTVGPGYYLDSRGRRVYRSTRP
jgi:hypothetical protein